ncbi:MAG TPA: class I SAM-dependent methyltransferase [Candidatus Dormibacteraeota bacterium]|nr:class I SAM-dependent methyltransferase [Candidatus Dormibacteraeota bacterium]
MSGYDEIADGYERHWGPVIRPAAEAVLDLLQGLTQPDARLLDVGTGTGALAIAALERWPQLRVTGLDPSQAMLDRARANADARLGARVDGRLDLVRGDAAELPTDAASFDAVVSSFVLQLVDRRPTAMREARRVLRPGGTFAWVAWLAGDAPFRADQVANEVLDDYGFDPPEPGARGGEPPSAAVAAAATRRAGFSDVRAHESELVHAWTPEGYLAFFTEFDEASLFEDLGRGERRRIVRDIGTRLRRLSPDELTMRLPTVYVRGRVRG